MQHMANRSMIAHNQGLDREMHTSSLFYGEKYRSIFKKSTKIHLIYTYAPRSLLLQVKSIHEEKLPV